MMYCKKLFIGVVGTAALTLTGSVCAQSALAEEIWSINFCQQAVSLAEQHGESPDTLNLVNCQGLRSLYQPDYWQCVIAALKADVRLKLDAARQHCLAGY